MTKKGLPVLFLTPDPIVIFASPNEDENGIPEHVIVWYERMPWSVKLGWPQWTNPRGAGLGEGKPETVQWLEYWDKNEYYYEADEEPVLKGKFQKNIYGFVPWVHKVSPFGKISPEGRMEELIVGRLTRLRDLIIRQTAITSDVDNGMHMFSNQSFDVQPVDDQHEVPENFAEEYEMGAGFIHEIPAGITVTPSEQLLPSSEAFQYLYKLDADIGAETPASLTGATVGATGRQLDIAKTTAMNRFEGVTNGVNDMFSVSVDMALKMIDTVPGLYPNDLKKGDTKYFTEVTIQLKPEDPVEMDRMATLGSRLYAQNEIDPITNLVQYKGYSQDEAMKIMIDMLKWKVLLESPEISQIIGLRAAEKSGMAEYLQILQNQANQPQKPIVDLPTNSAKQRATGEVRTPMGREMVDSFMGKGSRRSPSRFTQA